MRSFLTMLGIIIGVMALVILVSLVSGATGSVKNTINSLGTNMISVTISDDKGNPIKQSDLDEWMNTDNIKDAAPLATGSMTGKFDDNSDTVTVYGTTSQYADIENLSLLLGRFIKSSDVDNNTDVCVINETFAQEIIGYEDCLGKVISLDGAKYTVVGVLEDDTSSLTSMFGSGDMICYIPYTSYIRLSTDTTSDITSFYISCADNSTTELAKNEIEQILLDRFEDDDDAYDITTSDTLESAMSNITSILTILLGGIAGISLVVGGIGIMNIMLVTVTERTREIGIRKAIGASRRVILQQFLLEAVVLCMIGCAIGIFLSWTILRVISVIVSSLDLAFSMNATVVIIAVAFCFFIGVVFGLYPANKAAKMKPIDALHYGD
jgi:putative ABC transport system permease protein